jgi:hypothetical protein
VGPHANPAKLTACRGRPAAAVGPSAWPHRGASWWVKRCRCRAGCGLVRNNYPNPAHTRTEERMRRGGRIGPCGRARCERDADCGNYLRNAFPRATVRSIGTG